VAIDCRPLSRNVFLVSNEGCKPILYAPLQGVVLEVNDAYAESFAAALGGDAGAAGALGMEPSALGQFIATPDEVTRRVDPQWPGAFAPAGATIFLTHKCTLRCAYCYCHGGEGKDMPWAVLEQALRFVAANAGEQRRDLRLAFHGGDVGACWSLFQECVEFVEQLCGKEGIKPVLTLGTNGFYTRDQALYISQHVAGVTVSIDGDTQVHDAYRVTASGRPSLARVLDSVGVFETAGMDCSVRMTVTRKSVAELSNCVGFICENTQAAVIRAEPLYSRGRAVQEGLEPPDAAAFVDAFRAASVVAREHGRQLTYSGARFTGFFGSFCSYPTPTFGVTPEGNLTCCYEVLHPDDPLREMFFYGNIPPDGSTVTVDAQRVSTIRTWAKRRREACAECFCVFSCAGDCAAKVMDAAQSDSEPSTRCRITRSLVYDMLQAALAGEAPMQMVRAGGSVAEPS
jgi:uncharacterized protein